MTSRRSTCGGASGRSSSLGGASFAEGEALAREAIGIIEAAQDPDSQGYAYIDLAEVLRMAGRRDEATRAADEAAARFDLKANTDSAARRGA